MTVAAPRGWEAALRRLARSPLVVLLDVDGTLAPIVPRPEDARVPDETRRVVAALADEPGVHVALVSGRAAAEARRMVAVARAWVIGNHGMETIAPDGGVTVDPAASAYRPRLAEAVARLSNELAPVAGVQVEDKTWTLTVHYRRASPEVVPRVHEAVVAAGEAGGLRMTEGKMVYELRPPVEVHKGVASLALVHRLAGEPPSASVLYVGDDRTDEDAFRTLRAELPEAVTVRVAGQNEDAHRTSAAEILVPDVDAVRELLERLLAARRAA